MGANFKLATYHHWMWNWKNLWAFGHGGPCKLALFFFFFTWNLYNILQNNLYEKKYSQGNWNICKTKITILDLATNSVKRTCGKTGHLGKAAKCHTTFVSYNTSVSWNANFGEVCYHAGNPTTLRSPGRPHGKIMNSHDHWEPPVCLQQYPLPHPLSV